MWRSKGENPGAKGSLLGNVEGGQYREMERGVNNTKSIWKSQGNHVILHLPKINYVADILKLH